MEEPVGVLSGKSDKRGEGALFPHHQQQQPLCTIHCR